MRFGFAESLRRVRLSIALGSCGGFAFGVLAASTAQADHPPAYRHPAEVHAAAHASGGTNRWDWLVPDRIERIFGVGWGDGYHACPEGCPHRSAVHVPAPVTPASPLLRWFTHPWRHKEGANVGGAAVDRVKSGRTEIDGVEVDASAAIAAFHAPAWRGYDSWITPGDSVLDPTAPVTPPLTPEAVDAPLPSPEPAPAELPPGAVLDECELPAAVEQTYLFDPHPQPKLSDESIPIRSRLLAPLVRPAPLPSVSETPRPHRLPFDSIAPRTARVISPATR